MSHEWALLGSECVEGHLGSPTRDRGSPHYSHVPIPKALTPPGNQETDALAWIQAQEIDPSADRADGMNRKSGHHRTQVGWYIAKDARLSSEYSGSVKAVTACPVCSKSPRQLPK